MNLVQTAAELLTCKLQPASFEKRLLRNVAGLASDADVTPAQAHWVRFYAHRYRRQLGKCPVDDCPGCADTPWPQQPPSKRAQARGLPGAPPRRTAKAERDRRKLEEHNAAFTATQDPVATQERAG